MEEPVHNAAWVDTKAKMKHCIADFEKARIHHVDALGSASARAGGVRPMPDGSGGAGVDGDNADNVSPMKSSTKRTDIL